MITCNILEPLIKGQQASFSLFNNLILKSKKKNLNPSGEKNLNVEHFGCCHETQFNIFLGVVRACGHSLETTLVISGQLGGRWSKDMAVGANLSPGGEWLTAPHHSSPEYPGHAATNPMALLNIISCDLNQEVEAKQVTTSPLHRVTLFIFSYLYWEKFDLKINSALKAARGQDLQLTSCTMTLLARRTGWGWGQCATNGRRDRRWMLTA